MTEFAVWAPEHTVVELEVDGDSYAMRPLPLGWWWAEVESAGQGSRYGYSVDGGPIRPDPRSRWQPDGIDGLSAVVDYGRFAWHDGDWRGGELSAAVLYELHVGTFTREGTFAAVVEHLDYLVELGVTAIEIMPVAEFSGDRGWGYDGASLWAPHHAYGGPEGLKALVDAAHARGLAVVLDVVYNHLGPAGNYLPEYGPYFTDRYQTPWGSAINYDGAGSDGPRRFVVDNALMWLERYHIDGLRLDAVHAIVDQGALHILEELAGEVEALAARVGRPLWLIAESDRNDPRVVRPRAAGGHGLDASWSDDFHHALHAVLTGERGGYYVDFGRLADVARALVRVYVYGRDFSPYRNHHHGRPVGEVAGNRFLGYLQNHDQIGNRAEGERGAALMSLGRVKVGAALVLAAPFVPLLFQGEEWAASTPFLYFTDHHDLDLGRAVSDGRAREFAAFGWSPDQVPDPQDPDTWARSVLRWDEISAEPHASVLAWYRRLIEVRATWPELTDGDLAAVGVDFDEDDRWLRVSRGRLTLAVNLAASDQLIAVDRADPALLLASEDHVTLVGGGVLLPPDSVAILAFPAGDGRRLA